MADARSVALLAVTLAAVLAGCGGGVGATEYRVFVEPQPAERVVSEVAVPVDRTGPPVRRAILTGDPVRAPTTAHLGERDLVAANGSFYRVETAVVAERPATDLVYEVTRVANETPDVTTADLSPLDREVLGVGQPGGLPEGPGGDVVSSAVYANETELPVSVLAEGPVTVGVNGSAYRVEPVARTPTTRTVYRYTATRVAAGDTAYVAYVDDQFTVSLADAPADVRSQFRRLVETEGTDVSAEYGALRDALPEDRQVDEGEWFVRYGGTRYVVVFLPTDGVFGRLAPDSARVDAAGPAL